MTFDLVIIGAGGQGRECFDVVQAMNDDGARFNVIGFADDAPSLNNRQEVESLGSQILGDVESILSSSLKADICVGVASGSARARLDIRLREARRRSPTLMHPSSSVGSAVVLGEGSVVWAGARLTTNIRTGRHVHINQNATIGHDCSLGDYATVNPLAAISGNVRLGGTSMVGAGAVLLQGLTVGAGATIGASACVVRDVRAGATVKGVPAGS